jgi:hypothetical protein
VDLCNQFSVFCLRKTCILFFGGRRRRRLYDENRFFLA